jgi:hypothetical protein
MLTQYTVKLELLSDRRLTLNESIRADSFSLSALTCHLAINDIKFSVYVYVYSDFIPLIF